MNNPTMRNIVIGAVIVVVVLCGGLCLLSTSIFSSDDDDNDTDVEVANQDDGTGDENSGDRNESPGLGDSNIDLGNLVTAGSVDADGCAVQATDDFEPAEQIYIVAENSSIPAGTRVFVRLFHENQAVEDSPEITADQDYDNTCINFVFEDTDGFVSGDYEAQFLVNSSVAESVSFAVR